MDFNYWPSLFRGLYKGVSPLTGGECVMLHCNLCAVWVEHYYIFYIMKCVSMRLLRCLPRFLSSWYWALMSKSFLPSEICAQPQAGPKPSPLALPILPLCFYSLAPWLLLIYAPNQIIPQEPSKCSLFSTLSGRQCLTPWYTVFRTKDVIAALKKLLLKKTLKIWKVTF